MVHSNLKSTSVNFLASQIVYLEVHEVESHFRWLFGYNPVLIYLYNRNAHGGKRRVSNSRMSESGFLGVELLMVLMLIDSVVTLLMVTMSSEKWLDCLVCLHIQATLKLM